MKTNQAYTDGLLEEIGKLKKEKDELKTDNIELINQLEALAMDLNGVSCLVDGLVNLQDMNKNMFANSCRVLSRSIDDIASSMEASANGDSFYVAE
jgi:hypothetical protein